MKGKLACFVRALKKEIMHEKRFSKSMNWLGFFANNRNQKRDLTFFNSSHFNPFMKLHFLVCLSLLVFPVMSQELEIVYQPLSKTYCLKKGTQPVSASFSHIEKTVEGNYLVQHASWYNLEINQYTSHVGMLDSKGRLVLPVEFSKIEALKSDRFLVAKGGFYNSKEQFIEANWGVFDSKGREIIPVQFQEIRVFNDSIYALHLGGKWETQYEVELLDEELYWIENGSKLLGGSWFLYQWNGEKMHDVTFQDVLFASNDYILHVEDSLYKWVDHSMKTIYSSENPIELLSGNLLSSKKLDDNQWKFALFQSNGTMIHDFVFDELVEQKNGLIAVKQQNKWGFLHANGAWAIQPSYDWIASFSSNIPFVAVNKGGNELDWRNEFEHLIEYDGIDEWELSIIGTGKWGWIDDKGKELVAPKFDQLHLNPFSKNWIEASLDGEWDSYTSVGNRIPKRDKSILSLQTDRLYSWLSEDIARLQIGTKFGLIAPDESILLPLEYDFIQQLNWDMFRVESNGKVGVYSRTGKWILPIEFQQIDLYGNGDYFFVHQLDSVSDDTKMGFFDLKGINLVWTSHTLLRICSPNAFIVEDKATRSEGLIDRKGNWILNPEYEQIWYLNDQLVSFRKKGNPDRGLANFSGKIILPPEAKEFSDLSGNWIMTYQRIEDQTSVGLVSLQGKRLPADYKEITPFTEGLAFVTKDFNQWEIIDTQFVVNGTVLCQEVFPFEQGKAIVRRDAFLGVIDPTGKEIIPIQNFDVRRMAGGFSVIKLNDLGERYTFFYSSEGNESAVPYAEIELFSEKLNRVKKSEEIPGEAESDPQWRTSYGLINQQGVEVIQLKYDRLLRTSNENQLFILGERGDKKDLFDESGKLLVGDLDYVGIFYQGMAKCQKNGKWGLINQHGKVIIPFDYENIAYFSSDLPIRVKSNGQYQLLTNTGKTLSKQRFDELSDFHNGLAQVKVNGEVYFINVKGKKTNK